MPVRIIPMPPFVINITGLIDVGLQEVLEEVVRKLIDWKVYWYLSIDGDQTGTVQHESAGEAGRQYHEHYDADFQCLIPRSDPKSPYRPIIIRPS